MLDVYDLERELKDMTPVEGDEDQLFDLAWERICDIMNRLPNVWKDDLEWLEVDVATNGDELLFKYRRDCEKIADLLDSNVFGWAESHTGYYDPDEDARDNCVDANTGWYYILN